jgi:hypothetical protein
VNTCPATLRHTRRSRKTGDITALATTCGGWLRFYGISITKTFGWRAWHVCTSPYCGLFVVTDQWGEVRAIQRTEPAKGLFKTDAKAA